MKLQLKRMVRTPESEQYALFDQDRLDEEGLPLSLGKLDLHYTAEGIFSTLLLWRPHFADHSDEELRLFVQGVMDEFTVPMGVCGEFLVETFFTDEGGYQAYSNMVRPSEEDDEDAER